MERTYCINTTGGAGKERQVEREKQIVMGTTQNTNPLKHGRKGKGRGKEKERKGKRRERGIKNPHETIEKDKQKWKVKKSKSRRLIASFLLVSHGDFDSILTCLFLILQDHQPPSSPLQNELSDTLQLRSSADSSTPSASWTTQKKEENQQKLGVEEV